MSSSSPGNAQVRWRVVEKLACHGFRFNTQRDYIDPAHSDVVWFVRQFAAALGIAIDDGLGRQAAVHAAAESVHGKFRERSAELGVRAHGRQGVPPGRLLTGRPQAADAHAGRRDPGPGSFHQSAGGDPACRTRKTPGARRAGSRSLEGAAHVHAACAPRVPEQRRAHRFLVPEAERCRRRTPLHGRGSGWRGRAGHDRRLYRRVDTDGLHTPDSLFTPFLEQGLPAALGQLRQRAALAQAQVPMSAKRADDASAILWRAPAHPC